MSDEIKLPPLPKPDWPKTTSVYEYTANQMQAYARDAVRMNTEELRADADRYRWLRTMAREQLLNPKMASSEYPDMRTYWRLPTLICSGPVGGFVEFDAAIDLARGEGIAALEKKHRTVTYVCPVCAASLERQE